MEQSSPRTRLRHQILRRNRKRLPRHRHHPTGLLHRRRHRKRLHRHQPTWKSHPTPKECSRSKSPKTQQHTAPSPSAKTTESTSGPRHHHRLPTTPISMVRTWNRPDSGQRSFQTHRTTKPTATAAELATPASKPAQGRRPWPGPPRPQLNTTKYDTSSVSMRAPATNRRTTCGPRYPPQAATAQLPEHPIPSPGSPWISCTQYRYVRLTRQANHRGPKPYIHIPHSVRLRRGSSVGLCTYQGISAVSRV